VIADFTENMLKVGEDIAGVSESYNELMHGTSVKDAS